MVRICTEEYPTDSECNKYFKEFNYSLSSFQKYAIEAIVTGNHILITAHTGSGKTLPAEFAIKHFVKKGKKVIYTAPIKALSNQKFHEFTQKYSDISFGILTGDIKFNPEADVLIMTTEILRNTLFQNKMIDEGSLEKEKISLQFEMDVFNELGCVIFDEVHYINDADRGKVWEETIMMLPNHIQMVMLSATIDRPEQFAQWVERTKQHREKIVYLAPTNKRVVPLKHLSYVTAPSGIYKKIKDKEMVHKIQKITENLILMKDDNTPFNEETFHKIKNTLDYLSKNKIYLRRQFVLNNLVKYLNNNNMLPAICFVFSRKNVERCAQEMTISLFDKDSTIPATIKQECKQILMKLPNYKEYLDLPEYTSMIKLFVKGIAIHHSGVMPILREMVEILFGKGYIKLLFATETFAVGINMPTKTVIFSNFEKFDGSGMRLLMPHEYTQMAGRAGRRGIDSIGYVIHCNNLFPLPYANEYKMLLHGNPQTLKSKFKISYNLILNLYAITASEEKLDNLTKFTTKSMIQTDINNELKEWKNTIEQLENTIIKKEDSLKYIVTPLDVIKTYKEQMGKFQYMSNKQRKKVIRENNNLKSFHKNFDHDIKQYEEVCKLYFTLDSYRDKTSTCKHYMSDNIQTIITLLQNDDFIDKEKNILTTKGLIATNIQEVHPLAFTDLLIDNDYFKDLSTEDIVGIFSCFTNVSVQDELKFNSPQVNNQLVNNYIIRIEDLYDKYLKKDFELQLDTGLDYTLHYDLVQYTIDWCNTNDENSCKSIIQRIHLEKDIFLGEFVKAILKINNMANEFIKIAELIGNIDLLNKLSKIPESTLKFVATNQSLYI